MRDGATPPPRILIVEHDQVLTHHLRRILRQQGYQPIVAETGADGFAMATQQQPDMAIIDVKLPDTDGHLLCRRLRAHPASHSLPILLLRRDNHTASKIAVIEAGANDHITQPFYPDALIYRVKSALVRTEAPSEALIGARGRSFAFFGCKGGVGATTLAVNLAVALNRRGVGRGVLFDADFCFGNVAVHLDLERKHSVLDLVRHLNELEQSYIDQILAQYRSELRVLLGPPLPEQAELVSAEHMRHLLSLLLRFYDYLVVDCPTSYSEQALTILENVDDVLLVLTPEVGAIRNASIFMDLARRLSLSVEKIHIVLNRANSNEHIGVREIERSLQHSIEFTIVSSGQVVVRSLTQGIPMVLEQPQHSFSQQIFSMADRLYNRATEVQSEVKLLTSGPAPAPSAKTAPLLSLPDPSENGSLLRKLWRRVGSA